MCCPVPPAITEILFFFFMLKMLHDDTVWILLFLVVTIKHNFPFAKLRDDLEFYDFSELTWLFLCFSFNCFKKNRNKSFGVEWWNLKLVNWICNSGICVFWALTLASTEFCKLVLVVRQVFCSRFSRSTVMFLFYFSEKAWNHLGECNKNLQLAFTCWGCCFWPKLLSQGM